jgi:hypothetical protein
VIIRAVDLVVHWMDFTYPHDDGESVSPGWVAGCRHRPGPGPGRTLTDSTFALIGSQWFLPSHCGSSFARGAARSRWITASEAAVVSRADRRPRSQTGAQ